MTFKVGDKFIISDIFITNNIIFEIESIEPKKLLEIISDTNPLIIKFKENSQNKKYSLSYYSFQVIKYFKKL